METENNEDISIVLRLFPILDNSNWEDNVKVNDETITKCFDLIHRLNLYNFIEESCISRIEDLFRNVIVPKFWNYYTGNVDNDFDGFKSFSNSIRYLYLFYQKISWYCETLDLYRSLYKVTDKIYNENCTSDALHVILRASLHSQLPVDYKKIIESFYRVALYLEENLINKCCCNSFQCQCLSDFNKINGYLMKLQLLEPFIEQVLMNLICKHIEVHIEKLCQDNYDVSHIDMLEKWLNNVVLSWLKRIYTTTLNDDFKKFAVLSQKLKAYIYNSYNRTRINQIFNIIIEYPDSIPALEDLKICLAKTNLKPLLIKKLQKSMETRLLHPGVNTPDILTAYVAAIRSMRVLDPSGLLLETIAQPVHQYLRSREDTVRCVVSSLTEEGPNDLAEELIKGDLLHTEDQVQSDDESDNWESWKPDPIDADSNKLVNYKRTSDIISMLVNVYGSKELFVNEYRTLLADRLLTQFSCDTEKEIRYLELLKLRFGDSQLHYCEVMLKDIADSKRINQHVKEDGNYAEQTVVPLSAMILSAQFWPPFKEDKLELNAAVHSQMEDYTKGFETLKRNRTLSWKHHIGIVDLEIELPNRTLNLSVSPVHATIILYFKEKNEWHLEALSRKMNVPSTLLKRKIAFWQSHGLIEEVSTNVFQLCEENVNDGLHGQEVVEEYEAESAMASAEDQREEELQTFWSYIIGMLMNLDSLPLERIHQMLKMFAFQGPTIECTVQELKKFLDRKVREHELVFSGGLYRLPK